MVKYIGDLFIRQRFFVGLSICVFVYVISYFLPSVSLVADLMLFLFLALVMIDYIFLFIVSRTPIVKRHVADRMSNGDDNTITLTISNTSRFTIDATIIDELPVQFQIRDWKRNISLTGRQQASLNYTLRPLARGEYHFGNILAYISTVLGLCSRRITISAELMVPVYPSFMQLRKYELLSHATIQTESGNRRMRKIGHSMEFEQVKEYVQGDDARTVNWKASARKGGMMVNTFTDERSQSVYCIIDKGRLMKMPFSGMTLLDHSINSCLVLSSVCLQKHDRVGLLTFSNKVGHILPAERKAVQKENIIQLLYKQKTDFLESDFETLYTQVRHRIKNRSLLILFTNFESLSGLNRQIDYLRLLASHHLLLVIFFENTELQKLTQSVPKTVEDIYIKTVAEKFAFEKRLIVKELLKFGIQCILTSPENLTINTINKYLELKARRAL